jgi:predicted transcriptional regulator
MGTTTIQVGTDTKEKLNGLKIHPRETYDDLINRLVDAAYDDEPLSDEERDDIRASERDITAGRVRDLKEIMKALGDDKKIQSVEK